MWTPTASTESSSEPRWEPDRPENLAPARMDQSSRRSAGTVGWRHLKTQPMTPMVGIGDCPKMVLFSAAGFLMIHCNRSRLSNHQKSYWTGEPGTWHSDAIGQFDVFFLFLPFLPRCFATTMQHLPSKSQNAHALPCVSIIYIYSILYYFMYSFIYSFNCLFIHYFWIIHAYKVVIFICHAWIHCMSMTWLCHSAEALTWPSASLLGTTLWCLGKRWPNGHQPFGENVFETRIIYIYVCISYIHIYIHIYIYTYIYMYMCIYIYVYVYVYVYVFVYVCMYVSMYVFMYVCMYSPCGWNKKRSTPRLPSVLWNSRND